MQSDLLLLYRNTGDQVWFKKVTCEKDTLHLLRCKYEVATGDDINDCNTQLVVQCGKFISYTIIIGSY